MTAVLMLDPLRFDVAEVSVEVVPEEVGRSSAIASMTSPSAVVSSVVIPERSCARAASKPSTSRNTVARRCIVQTTLRSKMSGRERVTHDNIREDE